MVGTESMPLWYNCPDRCGPALDPFFDVNQLTICRTDASDCLDGRSDNSGPRRAAGGWVVLDPEIIYDIEPTVEVGVIFVHFSSRLNYLPFVSQ